MICKKFLDIIVYIFFLVMNLFLKSNFRKKKIKYLKTKFK